MQESSGTTTHALKREMNGNTCTSVGGKIRTPVDGNTCTPVGSQQQQHYLIKT